jgi:G3E family GTPase
MRVTLLLGFLGAGKTTLLQNILARGLGSDRVAVIVNEFGAVGVDGDILAGRALDTIELASGCICCSLKGSLLDAIDELAGTVAPDRLLIEASGVAQPDDVAAALVDPGLASKVELAPVITIVDAARYRRMVSSLGRFYAEQVARADIVVINKIDLAPADEVEQVRADIVGRNSRATVVYAERCDVDVGELLKGHSHFQQKTHSKSDHSHDHVAMISIVIDMISEWSQDDFEMKFKRLPDDIWRIKGFARIDRQSQLVQYAAGSLEITPVEERERHYLVIIGIDLDRDALARLFGGSAGSAGDHA